MANADLPDVDEQAVRWAAREAYGELTAEGCAELEAWLSTDRRNRGAYLRARAGLYLMEDAVTQGRAAPLSDNDNGYEPGDARRAFFRWASRIVTGGLAMAACIAAMVAIGVPVSAPFKQADVASAQVVNLKDGSVVTLSDDARIEVALSDGVRKVTLLSGQATFKVAKDKARPFVVRSGEVYAQATGTVYSVRRLGVVGGAVNVTEGSVLVWARDERDQAVLLHAGGRLSLDPGPVHAVLQQPAPPALPPPELAQISLDDVPISSAVARFNRINRTKIILEDPAIGNTRIVGLFKANEPEEFAQAAATISGATITLHEGNIVIEMK